MNLRMRLLLLLILPVFLVWGGVNIYSYYNARNILQAQITDTLSYAVESNSHDIYNLLKPNEAAVSMIADYMNESGIPQTDEIRFLKHIKASWPGIQSAYTGYAALKSADSQGVTEKEKPAGYDPKTRDWYKAAMTADGVAYTPIYEETKSKRLAVGVVKKIVQGGQSVGVAGITLDVDAIRDIAKNFRMAQTGYAAVLDNQGNLVYYPDATLKDNISDIENGALASFRDKLLDGQKEVQQGKVNGREMLMASSPIGTTGWTFAVFVPAEELLAPINALGKVFIVSFVFGILILIGLIVWITTKIVVRVRYLEKFMEEVSVGHLSEASGEAAVTDAGDEIDRLLYRCIQMKSNLRNVIHNIDISAKELTSSSDVVKVNSAQSAEASTNVANSVSIVSQQIEKQVGSFAEISELTKNIAEHVSGVAATVDDTRGVAAHAADATAKGDGLIRQAVGQMDNMSKTARTAQDTSAVLEDSSTKIGQIVELISGIAGQTNLLALNAAIEAARAGEAGKGFAVVADEVRKLAEQSDQAARQISELITQNRRDIDGVVSSIAATIENVQQSTEAVYAAGKEFKQISALVDTVSQQMISTREAMQKLTESSRQIASSAEAASRVGSESMGEVHNVSAAAEEQSAAISEIAVSIDKVFELAQALEEVVKAFKL
jgi:methyl-accepting chemotaxis protein